MNRRQRRAQASTSPAQAMFADALQHHRAMQLDGAERLYRKLLAIDPRHADSLHMLGVIALQQGRNGEAVALIGQALALKPDFAVAHNNLGIALRGMGRLDEAHSAFRRALDLLADYAEARSNLGNVLRELGRNEEALTACRRAIELKPDHAEAWVNLGAALQEMGQTVEAVSAIERALAIDPSLASAWFAKSDLKTFAPGDADITAMEELVATAEARRLSPEDRLNLEFALGKAWMDAREPDRAFAHLETGNRLKRASLAYDVEADAGRFAAIARSFTPEVMARLSGAGDPSDRPVFIIGMPRSGTSLVEQILASHPKVHGAGELPVLETLLGHVRGPDRQPLGYPQLMSMLAPRDMAMLGRAYVEAVSTLAPDKPRLVDKMPANFRFAGLIHLMLPNARIIHCRRDPIDTGLSCYSKKFTRRQDFTYDLRDLGLYHRAYVGLMAHWRGLLPAERFIEVDYEAVVEDLEGQARRLIGFCGLDWDPACLGFHQTQRQVRTASANQVRQPLYRTSLARWKPYERHLKPLLEALK